MALEQRGAGRYYYRKVWQGGTCRSEYIGAGELGAMVARLDAQQRAQREAERQTLSQEQAEQDAIDRQIDERGAGLQDLVTAVLLVTGHHQHKRTWRRQRGTI